MFASKRWRRSITAIYLFCLYASLGIARSVAEYLRTQNLLRLTVSALFSLVLPAVLLWRFSVTGRQRMLRRVMLLLILLAAAFILSHTPEERLHFLTYGLLGWLFSWTLEEQQVSLFWPLLFVWLAGTGDELIQGLLPNRVFDLRDILFNGIAGAAGIAIFATGRAKTWQAK